jgi:hypothetical protein
MKTTVIEIFKISSNNGLNSPFNKAEQFMNWQTKNEKITQEATWRDKAMGKI